jgi:hypothetical protein
VEHFQAFYIEGRIEQENAGDVATRSIQTSYKATFDRIIASEENDWDRLGSRSRRRY